MGRRTTRGVDRLGVERDEDLLTEVSSSESSYLSSSNDEEGVWGAERVGIVAVNAVCSAVASGELAVGAVSAAVKTAVNCSTINGVRLAANDAARPFVAPVPARGTDPCCCLEERCERLVDRELLEDDDDPKPESDDVTLGGPIDQTLEGGDG